MDKSELRRLFLERRRSLSAPEIADKSRRVADLFFDSFSLANVKTVHCFVSIPKMREIDTAQIYERLWTEFPEVTVVVPRMDPETGELESRILSRNTDIAENRWGIREPVDSRMVPDNEIDLVLVPVLAYDRNGNRVGYGKGFYDRFLDRCRPDCQRIGVSLFEPVDAVEGVTDDDVPLQHCITPDRIYTFGVA